MKRLCLTFCWLILCGLCAASSTAARGTPKDDISKLVGDWSGESLCADKEKFPACKDEQVVYHMVLTAGKPDTVTVTADKIVNGEPETMGVIDFVYDAPKQKLAGEYKNGRVHLVLEFDVKGDTLEGIFYTLPDRTAARRVRVKKDQ